MHIWPTKYPPGSVVAAIYDTYILCIFLYVKAITAPM